MKQLVFIIGLLAFVQMSAQEDIGEVITFSEGMVEGNARYMGTAGAMGAIGANLSAILVNPAGSMLYTAGEMELTTEMSVYNSSSLYLDNSVNATNSDLKVSELGFVINVFEDDESPLSRCNFGFIYSKNNSFNKKVSFYGVNNTSSITEDMLAELDNGYSTADYSELGWNTYAVDVNDSGWYVTPFNSFDEDGNWETSFGEDQYKTISVSGAKKEYAFNWGMEFHEKILFGFNFSVDQLQYDCTKSHVEIVNNTPYYDLNKLEYLVDYGLNGIGYSASLGILIKPIDRLRIGGALHTPTTYSFTSTKTSSMETNFDSPDENGYYSYYDSYTEEYTYKYVTPTKAVFNIAYIYKNIGFLDIDYERIDYGSISIDSKDVDEFVELNSEIGTDLAVANNFKIGGELRYGAVSFRAGYAMYENPYAKADDFDFYKTSIAGGIGFRGDRTYLDIAYVYTNTKESISDVMYTDYYGSEVTGEYDENRTKLAVTLGVKF